jgi:hypothetical protein
MIALPAELPGIINFRRGRKSFQSLGFPRRRESRILVSNLGSAISGEMSIAGPLVRSLVVLDNHHYDILNPIERIIQSKISLNRRC